MHTNTIWRRQTTRSGSNRDQTSRRDCVLSGRPTQRTLVLNNMNIVFIFIILYFSVYS
jgi:hypothetical protein